jgi:hypothetical protein
MNIWRSDSLEMYEQHVHYLQFITALQLTVISLKAEASVDVWKIITALYEQRKYFEFYIQKTMHREIFL